MIFRNINLGWRNILKNKFFSILNIGGVGLGLAVTTLILLWVVDELNYNRFHENLDQIYSVYEHQVYSEGKDLFTGCTPFPLSHELKTNYPEVLDATTYTRLGNQPVKFENIEFKEVPLILADKNFLNIFSFNILEGDPNSLADPNKIIVTQKVADMFFKGESPIGKTLTIYGSFPFTVGALIAEPEGNSTINFDILASIHVAQAVGANLSSWGNNLPATTVLLAQGTNAKDFESKITALCKDNGQENTSLYVFPFKKTRLYNYSDKNNRIQYIYQFLAIALIIVLIASINFVNSSTASSETRRPEVGIRKVLGATKNNITTQFIFEKGLMICISILISFLLVLIFAPLFVQLSGKTITWDLFNNRYLISMLIAVVLVTLVLSVAYPSLYISSFMPARILRKTVSVKKGRISFRSSLVVIQFALSIILVISTIAVTSQLKFINNYDLGYNQDNLIYINLDESTKSRHEALSNEFVQIPGIVNITKSDKLPFSGGNSSWGYNWQGKDAEKRVLICQMRIDRNYFETLGINLAEGRTFSPAVENSSDNEEGHVEVVLNKEAIRRMELNDPVGKFIERDNFRASISGIAEDFHFESLRREMEPMLMIPLTSNPDVIIMRVNPDNFTQTLSSIKDKWASIIPDAQCEIGFFDQRLQQMYDSEIKISGLFKYFSIVAIFIACIGLFGLSVFAIERKKKEIGIRKVNGSKVTQIIAMLNKDFIKWVAIAFVIAIPIAYYAMNKWLENFAYKTSLSWWIFALAGVLALGIALLTVSWQSWRAATRNPVEALRYE